MGNSGYGYPTLVLDGSETDGAWHMGVKGRITGSDGSDISKLSMSTLNDGRVVLISWSGYDRNAADFRLYTLVQDPGGRTGTIGANGHDFQVTLGNNVSGSKDNFTGRLAGDYLVAPPPPPPKGTVLILY